MAQKIESSMERFFISGCQRSGTTLLRLTLESHPLVHCFDEARGYEILINESRGVPVTFRSKAGAKLIGFKIPRFAEQLLRSVFNDPDYGRFPSFYRAQRVIHIVRDVRDVVASMISHETVAGESWIKRYGRAILVANSKSAEFQALFSDKYRLIEKRGFPAHLVGALYWEMKNRALLELADSRTALCAVCYERLVTYPENEFSRICKFLDLPWSNAVVCHTEYAHDELDVRGLTIGDTDPRRPIDVSSIGRYNSVLDECEEAEVVALTAATATEIKDMLDT